MTEIINQVKKWDYLNKLPNQIFSFNLNLSLKESGTLLHIFSYENQKSRRSFSIVYDAATKDFLGRVIIGLTEYYDTEFIFTNLDSLEKALSERLEVLLHTLDEFDKNNIGSVVLSKGILTWSYGQQLPKEISGFELFITSDKPIKIINGSFIIIDYSDFVSESNFVVCYNIYRDEFFAEIKILRTPRPISLYDTRNLEELKESLEKNLISTINTMRSEINT